ncbi:aldehyde dehydrogenase family protein [Paracoccus aminophilus]|uniref:Aldehyde dehydrogenase (NAD+) n=1 Tax=Paracoccus aminophilus JCM 7686 TaxID=1367847 RepID=S5YBN5_PARAH|nr:aldehyde dehydrogenase family protein [Paracoccus aminophilus]AGT08863.1 aldehyde dehydrogenase (NAD+) [Paracoccus aminophilus JCM 7686]
MTQNDPTALAARLGASTQRHFIDGQWQAAASGETIETRNPATGAVLTRLARGSAEDVARATAAARRAFTGPWSRWRPAERQELLHRILQHVLAHFDELALLETLDMGAPLSRTRSLSGFVRQALLFYASQVHAGQGQTLANSLQGDIQTMTLRAPAGVIGGIIPWNAPLVSLWWIVAPAIASGCTVVLKPAEDASLTVLRVAELMVEAGLPEGVVNVVTGLGAEAGAALAASPEVDRLAFTGSNQTGRAVIEASASNFKRLQLELGGKSPNIVFADADLDLAVPGAAMAVFNNSGQICYAGSRLLVERTILAPFLERLAAFTAGLRVGDGLDDKVQLGPVVSARQLDQIMGHIAGAHREGARLIVGGERILGALSSGYFIEPTIFCDVSNHMAIARQEIFGPVISVIPFDTPEEALAIANDTEYGLGAAVWTRNHGLASRFSQLLQAGTVWVNCYGLIDPAVGFGGIRHSGYGTKGGPSHVLDMFHVTKSVYINRG